VNFNCGDTFSTLYEPSAVQSSFFSLASSVAKNISIDQVLNSGYQNH